MGTASDTVGRPLTVTTAIATDVSEVVDPLFREYGEWVARRLGQDVGITFTEADLARHHDAFRAELPGSSAREAGCSWPASVTTRSG